MCLVNRLGEQATIDLDGGKRRHKTARRAAARARRGLHDQVVAVGQPADLAGQPRRQPQPPRLGLLQRRRLGVGIVEQVLAHRWLHLPAERERVNGWPKTLRTTSATTSRSSSGAPPSRFWTAASTLRTASTCLNASSSRSCGAQPTSPERWRQAPPV